MKVFLISSNICRAPYTVYPLGMGIVAGSLARAGHDVRQFDFLASGQSLLSLQAALGAFQPELVGVSIRNIDNVNLLNEQRYIDVVKEIVAAVRASTGAPIVLGGSGFSLMPEVILRTVGADYGIVGEGERKILDLVDLISCGEAPSGACVRSGRMIDGNSIGAAAYDPDLLAFYTKNGTVLPIQTKRGCDFGCIYCTYPVMEGAMLRCRDASSVVDDMLRLAERHAAAYVFFTDSVFNDRPGRFRELLIEMRRRGTKIPWTAFITPRGLDDEIVELMAVTGLKAAEIGADAACDATLAKLGKSFHWQDVVDTNRLFAHHGISSAHYFMFGGPGETEETVAEGIENLRALERTVNFVFMGIRILPGTPLARLAEREGIIQPGQDLLEPVYYIAPGIDREWLEHRLKEGFDGARHCIFPPDALDRHLQILHKLGYSGFWWNMVGMQEERAKRSRAAASSSTGAA